MKPSSHVKESVLHQKSVNKVQEDEIINIEEENETEIEEEDEKRRREHEMGLEAGSVSLHTSETNVSGENPRLRNHRSPNQNNNRKRVNTGSTTTSSARNNILIEIADNSTRHHHHKHHHHFTDDFILDFSAVNYIDTNGIQIVEELIEDFKHLGVFVYICHPQESFLKMICRLKLVDKFDAHVFLTIADAVRHFNKRSSLSSR